jgi:hypothetical protein
MRPHRRLEIIFSFGLSGSFESESYFAIFDRGVFDSLEFITKPETMSLRGAQRRGNLKPAYFRDYFSILGTGAESSDRTAQIRALN